jgi:hypothetical protein
LETNILSNLTYQTYTNQNYEQLNFVHKNKRTTKPDSSAGQIVRGSKSGSVDKRRRSSKSAETETKKRRGSKSLESETKKRKGSKSPIDEKMKSCSKSPTEKRGWSKAFGQETF